jgi:Fic family protein
MEYTVLEQKRDFLRQNKHLLPKAVFDNYEEAFAIEYTHNSTAIEGNTLSLMETKLVLEDKISVGGKRLREIFEVVNHDKAFAYVQKRIAEGRSLDEGIVKDIHQILMNDILPGGIYRNVDVIITGAAHHPPSPNEMYIQVKNFYADLPLKADMNPIELAAWTHAEFVKIHPFPDGNGRASRLIMNYQLMAHDFLPVSISKEQRLDYFDALERYAADGSLASFAEMVATLETARLDWYISAIEMRQGEQGDNPQMGMGI